MKKVLLFVPLALLLFSCSPKVTTHISKPFEPLPADKEVRVIGVDSPDPVSAIEVGTVIIMDSGMSSNCGWDVVIAKAKAEASKSGGDILKSPNI